MGSSARPRQGQETMAGSETAGREQAWVIATDLVPAVAKTAAAAMEIQVSAAASRDRPSCIASNRNTPRKLANLAIKGPLSSKAIIRRDGKVDVIRLVRSSWLWPRSKRHRGSQAVALPPGYARWQAYRLDVEYRGQVQFAVAGCGGVGLRYSGLLRISPYLDTGDGVTLMCSVDT